MGGAALHLGNIAEMKTGEGKTLVATLPTYLNALSGKGVHVVTVNDYLAQYHAEWMGRIYHFLGLTVGRDPARDVARASAARPTPCDVTYGTNNEFGFDYLRDNMANAIEECVQRGHNFAIVDEVDSILIDEARTPLIISGPTQDEVKWYDEFAQIVRAAAQGRRLRGRREEAHDLGPRAGHHQGRGPPRHRQPLRLGQHPADLVPQQRDQGQGAVPQRQGLRRHRRRGAHRRRAHRAHAARSSLQRGPAPGDRGQGGRDDPRGVPDPRHDHAAELLPALRQALRHDRHGDDRGLRVRQDLPARRRPDPDQPADGPRRPARPRLPHRGGEVRRHRRRHRRAARARASRSWSARCRSRSPSTCPGCSSEARHPAHGAERQAARDEAHSRRAGRPQGRGHGRHQHGRSRHRHHARRLRGVPRRRGAARARVSTRSSTPTSTRRPGRRCSSRSRTRSRPSTTRSTSVGGLYVVGTERHESRRIDNQLRGRSGRQGDPGESRFYLSLEDDLMRLFKSDWVDWVLHDDEDPRRRPDREQAGHRCDRVRPVRRSRRRTSRPARTSSSTTT